MAFLIPLLIPPIADATANLAIGLSNAFQATESSFSLQIGTKVYTNNKGFNLADFPYELREKILLMALEESRALIIPEVLLAPVSAPLTQKQLTALRKRSPMNPENPNYLSIMAETKSANGFPISSWRWLGVCREWWAILKRELWKDCVVAGWTPFQGFLALLDNDDFHAASFVRTLSLMDGFSSPGDLYTILTSPKLTHLHSLSILPSYPSNSTTNPFLPPLRPFPLGLQLIPTTLQSLSIGLPLDTCTNALTRTHLSQLALTSLSITLTRPTQSLLLEITGLICPKASSLAIRYLPTTEPLVDPALFTAETLGAFERRVVYLPKAARSLAVRYVNQVDGMRFTERLVELLGQEEGEGATTVYVGGGLGDEVRGDEWGIERVWPVEDLQEEEDVKEESSQRLEKKEVKKQVWERQTDLRLFGGLLGIRMEAKKH